MSIAADATRFNRNCSSRMPFPYLTNRLSTVIPNPSTAYDKILLGFDSLLNWNNIYLRSQLSLKSKFRMNFSQWIGLTKSYGSLCAFGRLSQYNTDVSTLQSFLQLPQVSTGKLKTYCKGILYYFQKLIKKLQLVCTGESNEKTKNVVRSFKNTKDSQITHNFFQSVASHESISAQNLNKMMR